MWTKENEKEFRELIKSGFSGSYIREHFGDKMKLRPGNKYVSKFSEFIIEEINYTKQNTEYTLSRSKSRLGGYNYIFTIKTKSGNEYCIDFIQFMESVGLFSLKPLYNLSFTSKEQHDLNDSDKYEQETNKYEHIELIKKIIFIIEEFVSMFGKQIFVIGDTDNPKKIKFYIDAIENSIEGVRITKDLSSINLGKDAYYIEFIN